MAETSLRIPKTSHAVEDTEHRDADVGDAREPQGPAGQPRRDGTPEFQEHRAGRQRRRSLARGGGG